MTSRPMKRQTTDEEAGRLALEYVHYRSHLDGLEPEADSWRHWCGSLALGAEDQRIIRAVVLPHVTREVECHQ